MDIDGTFIIGSIPLGHHGTKTQQCQNQAGW